MSRIPHRSDDQIRQAAEDLLHQYSPALVPVPVPIEEIVEIHLGLEIIPFRAYKQRFSADGSISTDLTNVTVDEEGMDRYPSRYRFTLAHEVGHLLLHGDYIQSLAHDEIADWKASLLSTTPTDSSRMEYQASQFAGCLLVPRAPLAAAFEEARQQLERRGFDIAELSDIAMSSISGSIAKQFEVSTQVVDIRLRNCIKRGRSKRRPYRTEAKAIAAWLEQGCRGAACCALLSLVTLSTQSLKKDGWVTS